jgi:hypothetical protein
LDIHQHHQRALCPRLTHGSLDLRRNDRLGRRRSHERFEHRREILRPICSNANPNPDFYGNPDTNFNCNSYAYIFSKAYANAKAYTDAEAALDSGAPPVKILISLDLQPLLNARPGFLNSDPQIATEAFLKQERKKSRLFLTNLRKIGAWPANYSYEKTH